MSVACGNKTHDREFAKTHHHDTVAQVRLCFTRPGGLRSHEEQGLDDFHAWEAKSEAEAERRNEQFFEERGGGSYAGSQEEARDRYFDSLNWEAAQQPQPTTHLTQRRCVPGQSCYCPKEYARCRFLPEDFVPAPVLSPAEVWKAQPLRDGKYTVETATGHRTFRLRTQASDDEFMPGAQIVGYLSGPDNQRDYTNFGTTTDGTLKVWKKHRGNEALIADVTTLLSNPEQALESVHCYRCHQELTTPESIALGMGSDCRKKGI